MLHPTCNVLSMQDAILYCVSFSTEHFILQFLKMPSLLEHTCMPSQSTVGVVPII